MATEYTVAVLVGSLRKDSLNLKLAHALARLAPANLKFEFVGIGDLPLYDQDLETATPPEAWTRFRTAIRAADAVLFVTPEYNRTIPGGLKNAIDVGSRPMGASVWGGKPAAVVSGSPGAIGGFGANHVLRQSLVFLDMPTLQQPEAYIGGLADMFGADGDVVKPDTRAFLEKIMASFDAWIARCLSR